LAVLRPDEARRLIEAELCAQAEDLLELDAGTLAVTEPLNALGLDSLAALNLKERIERGLGVSIPLAALADGMSAA
jgi:aryl carrier-like protein